MATSTYFRNFDARNDQELLHSLTTESIQIHGYDDINTLQERIDEIKDER